MKLSVADKEAFDRWRSQAIQVIRPHSQFLEDRISLLNVQKLSSLPLNWRLEAIEVLPTTSIKKVIHQLTGGELVTINGNVETSYHLYCLSASSYKLDPSKTLVDYDIQEGDLLLLDQVTEELGVKYSLEFVPTRVLIDFCRIVLTTEYLKSLQYDATFSRPILSVLLYTDEDVDLAHYIRYNFAALDEMTGHYINIYTIEQPTQVRGISAREYWKAVLEQSTYSFLHLMGWTRYKPYNKADAYKIASILGVYPDALPCIILFGNNIKSDEKIVITITGEIKTFFRGLSSVLLGTLEELIKSKVQRDDNFSKFKGVFIKNWSAWQKKAGGKKEQTTTFTFNGQTVFINRPSGQVEIKDFQNE